MKKLFIAILNTALTACSLTIQENPGASGRVTGRLVALDSNEVGIVGRATSTDRLTFPKSVKYRVLGLPRPTLDSLKETKVSLLFVVKETNGSGPWDVVVQAYSD